MWIRFISPMCVPGFRQLVPLPEYREKGPEAVRLNHKSDISANQ